ncbi:MAG: shikimate kinase [Christensenellales bacterium]
MKTNIVLVGLYDKMSKAVAKKLANELDMYLADLVEILKYNLMNEEEIEKICGIQYLNKQKSKIIGDISSYENSIIHLPYSIFAEGKTPDKFKKYGTTIFLKISPTTFQRLLDKDKGLTDDEKKIALLAYEDRTANAEKLCDMSVDIDSVDYTTAYKRVKRDLDNFLL